MWLQTRTLLQSSAVRLTWRGDHVKTERTLHARFLPAGRFALLPRTHGMDSPRPQSDSPETVEAPHPGSKAMPRWNVGELPDAPRFTWKNWASMLGPGLLAGGAAIGGGEWLMGPVVTARFGGNLLWLATLRIVGQVIYNIEISRYTLYTGEPIFTGKFRTLPGPQFWVIVYLLLDFGSVFPYLAANAATPLAAVILGRIPDAD